MKTFQEWLKESSYRTATDYPQDSVEHPEGSVRRHSMMVRHSLDAAIDLIKQKQQQDPEGPLSNLDLNFSPDEYNVLRLAGNLHDIGKGSSMSEKITKDGRLKIQNIGHDQPEHFEKGMSELGPAWQQMYSKADAQNKEDLWWLIKHHMSLDDARGIENKALRREILDDQGKYKSDRRIKLLLVLLLMDRMGRGGTPTSWQLAKQFAQSNVEPAQQGIQGLYSTSDFHKQNLERIASRASKPSSDNPQEFVAVLKQKGRTSGEIRAALSGKFRDLSPETINSLLGESRLSFRVFMEAEESGRIRAQLPLADDVFVLSKIFKDKGHQIYVIGGACRDFLKHYFEKPDEDFDENKIKDIDLTTDATPDQVRDMLTQAGIKNFGKGESFGVMVANLNGEDYEIATFREDLGYSDGRRPDEVRWADMATDYKRRDLTMNAIYYEIPSSPNEEGVFIDPSGGKGFEDIKKWKVRMIGDPFERIGEDKLRIARVPRFHSYYNNDDIRDVVDQPTLDAIEKYKDMRGHGVTGPRIQSEFWSGLKKSASTVAYLRNYERLGLLSVVFPNLDIDIDSVDRLEHEEIHGTKQNGFDHAILVLALLLRKNGSPDRVRLMLNKLEWPNEVSDGVAFLLKAWQSAQSPTPEGMSQIAQDVLRKPNRRDIISRSRHLAGDETDVDHLSHLGQYQPPVYSGEEIQRELGLSKPGPEIGQEMKRRMASHYADSLRKWKNNPPMEQ
jgi:tRNA nucleotidyltransferase/poly(A) polymerase